MECGVGRAVDQCSAPRRRRRERPCAPRAGGRDARRERRRRDGGGRRGSCWSSARCRLRCSSTSRRRWRRRTSAGPPSWRTRRATRFSRASSRRSIRHARRPADRRPLSGGRAARRQAAIFLAVAKRNASAFDTLLDLYAKTTFPGASSLDAAPLSPQVGSHTGEKLVCVRVSVSVGFDDAGKTIATAQRHDANNGFSQPHAVCVRVCRRGSVDGCAGASGE